MLKNIAFFLTRVASHFYKKIQEQFQNISSTLTCFSRTKNFDRQNLTGYQQGRSNIFWWERPNRNTPSLLPFPSSPLPGKRTLVALAGENFKIKVSTGPENTLPGSQNLWYSLDFLKKFPEIKGKRHKIIVTKI